MAAQKGSALLIKVGDGASPEVFTTVAGLRTKTVTLNNETVDITNSDTTSKQRQLLAAAGIQSLSVSGDGVFTDATADATIRTNATAQSHNNYQITIPDFYTITGPFQITTLEYAGEHNAEATYSLALESAGDLTWATV